MDNKSNSPEDVKAFFSHMSRHLVVLVFEYETYDKGKLFHRGASAITGLVIELHDEWYWTTAGHCLLDLDKLIVAGQLRIMKSSFMDYFGTKAVHKIEYPFHYETGCSISVYDMESTDSKGLDFGLIKLNGLMKSNFEANGVVPIKRGNWINLNRVSFENYRLLGVPEDKVGEIEKMAGLNVVGVMPVMVTIHELNPCDIEDVPSINCFAGRVHEKADLNTVKGMSGGPIFGFFRDNEGKWMYHVVALQSRWRPKTDVIFGCRLQLFAEEAHRIIGLYSGQLTFETGDEEYLFDEFTQHFNQINELLDTSESHSKIIEMQIVMRNLLPTCSSYVECMYKSHRFLDIMAYLNANEAAFTESGLVVIDKHAEKARNVSGALLYSIHQHFTTLSKADIDKGISVMAVIAFAKSCLE